MYHPLSLFIGLRYLWNAHLPKFKKFITFLSIISITISIASLIIIISIINGFEENFRKNILSFIPHLIITNKKKYINKFVLPKNVLKFNSIEKISDFINEDVVIKNKNNIAIGEIIGIDINNDENIRNYKLKNISKILPPKKYNAIIGKKLSEKIHVNIGDTIKLIFFLNKKCSLVKKNIKEGIFKISSIFSTDDEVDYYQILINKQDSQNFLNYSDNYITGWRVWLKDPLSLELNEIKELINPLIILDWTSQKGELFKAIKIEKYMIFFLFFLIFLVAILNIFINITIYTVEKKNTIAILKSLGLRDWKIISIFVILGSSTSIIGSILGTTISVFLIVENHFLKFFTQLFFNTDKILMIIKPSQIFFINIICILLVIFSTLYPSWHTLKSKPCRILSNE